MNTWGCQHVANFWSISCSTWLTTRGPRCRRSERADSPHEASFNPFFTPGSFQTLGIASRSSKCRFTLRIRASSTAIQEAPAPPLFSPSSHTSFPTSSCVHKVSYDCSHWTRSQCSLVFLSRLSLTAKFAGSRVAQVLSCVRPNWPRQLSTGTGTVSRARQGDIQTSSMTRGRRNDVCLCCFGICLYLLVSLGVRWPKLHAALSRGMVDLGLLVICS